jgi:hypothetical protein
MIIIKISLNEKNLWDEPVIAGGTTGVVQQQQQGSTSRASTASRWLSPSFLITLNNEILYHECIMLVQISDCQMLNLNVDKRLISFG